MRRACLLLLLCCSCTTKRTEVVIGVATDLPAPGSLDAVKLEIYRDGVLAFDIPEWPVPGTVGGDYEIPASFGVYADDGSEPRIEVLVHGLKNEQTLVTRRAVFSLIKEQTLFMRMALVLACVNNTQCPPDTQTCIEGVCKAPDVDSHTFNAYTSGAENFVFCSSGSNLIQTASGQPMQTMMGAVPCDMCSEGACYHNPSGPMNSGKDGGTSTGCPIMAQGGGTSCNFIEPSCCGHNYVVSCGMQGTMLSCACTQDGTVTGMTTFPGACTAAGNGSTILSQCGYPLSNNQCTPTMRDGGAPFGDGSATPPFDASPL